MWEDWKIRKIVSKGDYNYAVVPEHPKATKNGYVLEHRIVMENHIKRILLDTEVVHHINKNRKENNIKNLELMDKQEHVLMHAKEKEGKIWITLICPNCGKEFEIEERNVKSRKKNNKNIFCSRRCNGLFGIKNIVGFFPRRVKDENHGCNMYRRGCRCDICRSANTERNRKYRKTKSQ